MGTENRSEAPGLQLPVSVVSRVDLGRLLREVEALDDFLRQAAIRSPGAGAKLPRTSRLLDDIVAANQLNALHKQDRDRLISFLTAVKAQAPVLHMSFSADPSPLFTSKLVTWLRKEIHPFTLLRVGLQPTIGAGCVVRTTNKQFDLSLRSRFQAQRGLLISKLVGPGQPPAVPRPTGESAP